jgi:hypothetical protein
MEQHNGSLFPEVERKAYVEKLKDEVIVTVAILAWVVKSIILCAACLRVLMFLAEAYTSHRPCWGYPKHFATPPLYT